ncbi:hypothetical protein ATANTOWER_028864, partial [Ataeniobius toweri]|nr:hypothetical protein [Ataeniobius toweri]
LCSTFIWQLSAAEGLTVFVKVDWSSGVGNLCKSDFSPVKCQPMKTVAVLGGGIGGLAASFYLCKNPQVTK